MHEDQSSVSVAVFLTSGILARDVIVSLQTLNGTAFGKFLNNPSCEVFVNMNRSYSLILHTCLQGMQQTCGVKMYNLFFNAAGMDFSNTSLDLTFSSSSTTQTVMVPILNDAVPEDMLEYFTLVLISTDPAVSLNSMIANITIADDSDSKCLHFPVANVLYTAY